MIQHSYSVILQVSVIYVYLEESVIYSKEEVQDDASDVKRDEEKTECDQNNVVEEVQEGHMEQDVFHFDGFRADGQQVEDDVQNGAYCHAVCFDEYRRAYTNEFKQFPSPTIFHDVVVAMALRGASTTRNGTLRMRGVLQPTRRTDGSSLGTFSEILIRTDLMPYSTQIFASSISFLARGAPESPSLRVSRISVS